MAKVHFKFDMDGVLTDLSRQLALMDGYEDPVHWYIAKAEQDGKDKMYFNSIARNVYDGCFEHSPPMPHYEDMKALMRHLFNNGHKIDILSSCMDNEFSGIIHKQKMNWLNRYYGQEMSMFSRIDIVQGSHLKIQYVGDDYILIDDYAKTYNSFIEAGKGDQFIHYTSYEGCIQKLRELNII